MRLGKLKAFTILHCSRSTQYISTVVAESSQYIIEFWVSRHSCNIFRGTNLRKWLGYLVIKEI